MISVLKAGTEAAVSNGNLYSLKLPSKLENYVTTIYRRSSTNDFVMFGIINFSLIN